MSLLRAHHLTKIYGKVQGGAAHKALNQLNLTIEKGEFVAIMGPSGSGKTTLLQLLGTIDQATSGEIWINGENVSLMKQSQLADFRRKHLGFIFQDFQLLDALTLKENIILPLVLEKRSLNEMEHRLTELAERLGITQVLHHRPYEVSGGQKQRAAAARALIHRPSLILADEPTGNLDSKSSKSLMESIAQLNKQEQVTICMVTHDPVTASYCDRVIFIKDGKLYNEIHRGETREAFFEKVMHVTAALGGEKDDLSFHRL